MSQIKELLQKYNSRTLLNAGLFVFMLILVSLVILKPGKNSDPNLTKLTKLKQSDVISIVLQRQNEKDINLEKRDGIWFIKEPYQLPANDFRAQTISALVEAVSYLQYDSNNMELAKFKLDKPEVTIQFNNKVTLEIGGVDPIKNRRYVKIDNTLHLVNDTFYYQVIGKVTAYVSYQIVPPNMKLSKITLPKFTLSLNDGNWKLSPAQADVSADSINEFVNEWQHAQSLEIENYKGTKQKNNIRIDFQNSEQPLEFSLLKIQDSSYLVRHDYQLSYKLSDEIAEKLQKLPEPPGTAEIESTEPAAPAEPQAPEETEPAETQQGSGDGNSDTQ